MAGDFTLKKRNAQSVRVIAHHEHYFPVRFNHIFRKFREFARSIRPGLAIQHFAWNEMGGTKVRLKDRHTARIDVAEAQG
jgi:hypothetical protein